MHPKWCHLLNVSKKEIEAALVKGREATGISVKELRRMCLQGGLELLARGELKISAREKYEFKNCQEKKEAA